jgi:hypothetical protein
MPQQVPILFNVGVAQRSDGMAVVMLQFNTALDSYSVGVDPEAARMMAKSLPDMLRQSAFQAERANKEKESGLHVPTGQEINALKKGSHNGN